MYSNKKSSGCCDEVDEHGDSYNKDDNDNDNNNEEEEEDDEDDNDNKHHQNRPERKCSNNYSD